MTKRKWLLAALGFSAGLSLTAVNGFSNGIIHDAEFVKLQEQHGEKWAVEDKALDQKRSFQPRSVELSDKHAQFQVGYRDFGETLVHRSESPAVRSCIPSRFLQQVLAWCLA